MIHQTIMIINKLGLHARASARFVAHANRYASQISLRRHDQTVNGKSILGVMMLAATQNMKLELIIEGEDEMQAMEDLVALVGEKFGEAE